ncbi:MAG: AAA family ATPase [Bacteroidaceae bacterium]|nr:AAA family ATPase [Bacteroidaceae bacterium]
MKYIDVKSAAIKWQLTERRITTLCRDGRIEGAKKEGGVWLVPATAEKPIDGRKNKFAKAVKTVRKLPLPIGESDFKKLVDNYYYVDKTLMIKEFIDSKPKVSLFTRPRRFGKTLAMGMLQTFFEKSDTDNSRYFKDKAIWNCGEKYRKELGKYPVIFVTFKDIKYPAWEQSLEAIRDVVAAEYCRHLYLLESDRCNEFDKKYFRTVAEGSVTEVGLTSAFRTLSNMLHTHYGEPAVIIIDEYDTPIQQGYTGGYYEQIIGFMRNLLSGAFKDNSNLAYGFLTGILRVAKESIFSGLNNLTVHSIMDEKYSEYFGFTADEVREMAEYYGVADKYEDICEWYDGYRFGSEDIFNPWSVINYFYNNCTAKAYWQSTGDNSIIRQIVAEADNETADNLRKLLQGEIVSSYVDTSVIYPEIKSNPTTIYSFLLAAGYLKTVKKDDIPDGNSICDIAIPNKEIFYVYEREILSALSDVISQSTAIAIQQAIMKQNIPSLQENLEKLLLNSISAFDYAHENFYHGLVIGLCAVMNNRYFVSSNVESGHGRYDIQLRPINKRLPGIIIELKVLKDGVAEDRIDSQLEAAATDALGQIEEKKYVTAMQQEGFTHFFKIGAAFYKKHVKVLSQEE